MDGSILAIIRDISAIFLLPSGAALCITLAVIAVRAGPILMALLKSTKETAENLAKASGDAAEVTPMPSNLGPLGRGAQLAETELRRLWQFDGPWLPGANKRM